MNQSCAVFFMDHLSAGAIVLSKTSLITHRPEDYRCMVLVSLNNVLDTIEKHCFPFFSISRNMNIIGKQAMRLVVCLIHYINTVFIAKLIETWIVWIMRGTNSIYVVLFHQFKIFSHHLFCRNTSYRWIHLMTVRTTNAERLTIDQDSCICCSIIYNLNLTETNLNCSCFYFCFAIIETKCKLIQVRMLCGPFLRILYIGLQSNLCIFTVK